MNLLLLFYLLRSTKKLYGFDFLETNEVFKTDIFKLLGLSKRKQYPAGKLA